MKIFTRAFFLTVALCCWGIVGYGQVTLSKWLLTANGTPNSVASNVSAANFTAGTGVSAISFGTNGAFSSGWSTGALINNDYFQIAISPDPGFELDINELLFSERRSNTGIRDYQVRWSKDALFSTQTTIATVNVPDNDLERTGNVTGLSISVLNGETLYVRFYGYNAEASGGTWRINDNTLELRGVVSPSAGANDTDTEVYDPTIQLTGSILSTDDTAGEAVDVFAFDIEDQGSGDGLATNVTNIRIKPHTTNTADWTDHIQGIVLNNGAITIGNPTITDTEINIPITSGNLVIADGNSSTIDVGIFMKTSNIEDGAIFSCYIDADDHGFTADINGSSFSSSFLLGDVVGNDFEIEVDASVFAFQVQPSDVVLGNMISPAVVVLAEDENGNIDLDYNIDIPLSTTGTFDGAATTSVTPVNGVATFNNLIFSAAATGVTITALSSNDGFFVTGNLESTSFNVSEPAQIIISRVVDPGDDIDGRFVEIKNVGSSTVDISGWDLNKYVNGSTSPNGNVIDSGAEIVPGGTYIVGLPTFGNVYSCLPDEVSSQQTGNGDDAYALFDDNDILIDIYGVIGQDGTGQAWDYENSQAVRNPSVTIANPTWTASEWTITSADIADIDITCAAPTNDNCANATVLICGTSLNSESTSGASDNGDATGCSYGKGVWYSFAGTDQEVTVTADGSADNFDLGISVSTSDDCISFTNIACIDEYFGSGFEEYTFFANSGTTYYFYIAYYGNTSSNIGSFDISIACADVSISETTIDNCYSVDNITSTGSGAWLNIVDGSGDLAASVLDSENMGLLQTSIYINAGDVRQDGNNLPYLDRNISIEPTTQPSGTVKVRMYLTTAEFDALAAADSDVSSISDLNITKFDGGCSDEFNGAGTVVQQSASGTLNTGYFVEVDVTSFSNFFLHADLVALPVELTTFTAKALNNQAHLSFTTATEENNSHFLIQRSIDGGKTFETIGQVEGMGDSASPVDYEYVDTKPAAGMNYYRLQQFDFDGTNEFFGPVAVRFSGEVTDAPVIWPVPARERLQVTLPASDNDWLLEVFDLNGRRLLQQTSEEKGLDMYFDLNALPAGSYLLRWNNGRQSGQERFLKV
ncbi:lamin tail domain-containing protein [Lewinella sp. LCG006]|uniref:lamin tail domain-containing protein n=1 Tax=Lewinella sp. LCG006 TaxID=3231911 RepID=UPI003460C4A4